MSEDNCSEMSILLEPVLATLPSRSDSKDLISLLKVPTNELMAVSDCWLKQSGSSRIYEHGKRIQCIAKVKRKRIVWILSGKLSEIIRSTANM